MTRRLSQRRKSRTRLSGCTPTRLEGDRPSSYAAIVLDYEEQFKERADREMHFFAMQRDIDKVLEYAAYAKLPSGKRHPHQRRLKQSALRKVHQRLRQCDLGSCATFHQLFEMVRDAIGDIFGIGELMIYDTTHRIGAYLKLEPDRVYLHAGTRDGARALGCSRTEVSLDPRELPKTFHRLTPAEIEDCLCIYKRDLRRIRGLGER